MRAVIFLIFLAVLPSFGYKITSYDKCYDTDDPNDPNRKPLRCMPEFENVAFGKEVEASNTCGEDGPTRYCTQTGGSEKTSCYVCNYGDHPPSYLTDIDKKGNETWWQSGTMLEDLNDPNNVTLTIHFGKAYDVTYITVKFYSPRPASFAIYKKIKEDDPKWTPLQFYSSNCRLTYGYEDRNSITANEDARTPLCTSAYSDISPLRGGTVAFSFLEGRRVDSRNHHLNPALHEFVTATSIRIVLNSMNTFGDEIYGSADVLASYYYAITEIAIGARCKCNGHATRCAYNQYGQKMCMCEHFTTGVDCEKCMDFYVDVPWNRATTENAFACQRCNCSGFSDICMFDQELYEQTGHGGHCLDCAANRDGPYCERCREHYYMADDKSCLPCNCNDIGSRSLQCFNSTGKCDCKPGVTGDKCDQCALDFYDFSITGCKECNCSVSGSYNNEPNCDQTIGNCMCKENVEGKECNKCKPGFFNLDESNEFGCTPCFCYGHSPDCDSATGYSKVWLESMFARNQEKWKAVDQTRTPKKLIYSSRTQEISVNATGREIVYFIAPEKYLGDQRASYNQDLQFKLKVGESGSAPSVEDIILEGNGRQIAQTIFGQANSPPTTTAQLYKFRLHEHADYGWKPKISSQEFISILSNLTAIKIRGTYTTKGTGFLDQVKLGSAARGAAGHPANWVERCTCPAGYIGQFCESCAPGYRHDPPYGDSFSSCVLCNCNKHADECEANTGRCICQDNTAGDNCERCAHGYYGNALAGTPNDCLPCPCINNGACYQLPDLTVICLECPKGYAGAHCDQCSDGYYGDISKSQDPSNACQPCDCNGNVDLNAVNNCDRVTGECLKCIYNTGGPHCDQCLPGYFGDPLAPEKGDCKPCLCNVKGTEEDPNGLQCNQVTGQCKCKPNIIGTNCDQCKPGYYDLESGEGCKPCNCNTTGSIGTSCDLRNGHCICKEGVTGKQCDQCERFHFGFSEDGCDTCECDPVRSIHLQCNDTGHCPCLENVEGKNCDRCKENKFFEGGQCIDCPECYQLVQDEVNKHRMNLSKMDSILQQIKDTPVNHNDIEYDDMLASVTDMVNKLMFDAVKASGGDDSLGTNLQELRGKLRAMEKTLDTIKDDAKSAEVLVDNADKNATEIRKIIDKAMSDVKNATEYINIEGQIALQKARQASNETGEKNQQMSDIAQQARELVMTQLEEAKQTEEAAKEALDICDQAYHLLAQGNEKQRNATDELIELEEKIGLAKIQMEKTSQFANETLEKVNMAYQEALNAAVQINTLDIPKVDIAAIRSEALKQEEEAERFEKEALSFEQNYNELTSGLEDELMLSERNLTKARDLQQTVDALMARADAAYGKAEGAVKLGENTLKNAQEILSSMEDIDEKIKSGKAKAAEALDRIPEIEQLLDEAKEKTTNAKEALAGAESNAQSASKTAQMAQNKIAEEASKVAKEILKKAENAKDTAGDILQVADALGQRISETENKIDRKNNLVDANNKRVNEGKALVGKAKNSVDEAFRQIENASASLESIEKELGDLSDIDDVTLDQLEQKLLDAEKEFEKANLDEKLQVLTNARLNQQKLLKSYEEELERLEMEVRKIENIKDALPSSCFKRSRLEV